MDTRSLIAAVAAGLLFAIGGMSMRAAEGLTRLWPTVWVFASFVLGAAALTMVVRWQGEVGPSYMLVIGIESVVATALGVALGDRLSPLRLGGIALVLVGAILLVVVPAPTPGRPVEVRPIAGGAVADSSSGPLG
ncbi:MAG: hypothetical protein OEY23_03530 [Acidimicrobiia bacterium]|nr:hypothetical protein [Acidimicrobiia bacterium]